MQVTENVVMITGASAGLGEALAREYVKSGHRVVLCARRLDRLVKLAEELGPSALAVECDVCNQADVERAVGSAVAKFGRLDVLIANAGFGVFGSFEKLSAEDFQRQFDTNIFGVIHTVKAALPELKKTRGRLALVGSAYSYFVFPGGAPYTMSKFALRALAESLYLELRDSDISVTMACPGLMDSEFRKVDNQGQMNPETHDRVPQFLVMDSTTAAKKLKRAVDSRRREVIITAHAKFGVWFNRHFPGLFVFTVVRLRRLLKKISKRATSHSV